MGGESGRADSYLCCAAPPPPAVRGLPVPLFLPTSLPSLPKAWLGCGGNPTAEGFGCLQSILSCLPVAGGQSKRVTPLEQEPDAQWLSPMLSQEGRTEAGKGGHLTPGWSRGRQRTPEPPASAWAHPFGPEMRDRAWRKGFDFRGGRRGGTGYRDDLTALRG